MLRSGGEEVPTAVQAQAEAEWRQPSAPLQEPKRKTMGSVAMNAIRDGKTTGQVVEIVEAHFPDARISESSVNSYRSRLRSRGEAVSTAREATLASKGSFDLLVADLEAARAGRSAMATKADLSALESRLFRRVAWLIAAAGFAVVAALKLLS